MKISIYAAAGAEDRAAYRSQLLREIVPRVLVGYPDIVRCTVNIVDDELTGGLPGSKMGAEDVETGPTYDAVIEYWIDTTARSTGSIVKALIDIPGKVDAYWAQVNVAKDSPVARDHPPALRLISPCLPKAGMILPQVYRHWEEHVEKANRIHVGMSRYLQDWHMGSLTPDAPAYFGAPMLSFQTLDDWNNRFYSDPDGAREIAEDVGTFVESFSPLLTHEHRLK